MVRTVENTGDSVMFRAVYEEVLDTVRQNGYTVENAELPVGATRKTFVATRADALSREIHMVLDGGLVQISEKDGK